jgi:hypothetical protein
VVVQRRDATRAGPAGKPSSLTIGVTRTPAVTGGREIAPDGSWIEAERAAIRRSLTSIIVTSRDFHASLEGCGPGSETSIARSGERGKVLKNSCPKGDRF